SESTDQLANGARMREAAFDNSAVPQLVIDQDGCLVMANQQARTLFGINLRDLGRPFKDLEVSYRPIELRSRIEQAYAERRMINLKEAEWRFSETEKRYLDVQIMPLTSSIGSLVGVTVTFLDVTKSR